jgi:hypothetical protein
MFEISRRTRFSTFRVFSRKNQWASIMFTTAMAMMGHDHAYHWHEPYDDGNHGAGDPMELEEHESVRLFHNPSHVYTPEPLDATALINNRYYYPPDGFDNHVDYYFPYVPPRSPDEDDERMPTWAREFEQNLGFSHLEDACG